MTAHDNGHYTTAELADVADGRLRLRLADRVRLAAHLATCPECSARLTGLDPRDPELLRSNRCLRDPAELQAALAVAGVLV